jgi:hypothetical protein
MCTMISSMCIVDTNKSHQAQEVGIIPSVCQLRDGPGLRQLIVNSGNLLDCTHDLGLSAWSLDGINLSGSMTALI